MVWLFPRKNSKYPFLTSADFIELIDNHILTPLPPQAPVTSELDKGGCRNARFENRPTKSFRFNQQPG
jgi:hypothetical protein